MTDKYRQVVIGNPEFSAVYDEGRYRNPAWCAMKMNELTARVTELEGFKKAVLGWREYDHPEGFCRFSAEYVANLGREALNRGRDDD